MARSFAPNVKNIRNFSGHGYFQKDGEARARNLGHVDSISRTIDVTREDIWISGSGTRLKGDVETTEIGASVELVLRETTARNLALAYATEETAYIQEAATAVISSGTDALPGELVDLGYIDVESVIVTDGTDELVEGVDYELDAAAGTIEFLTAQAIFDITFDAPAIIEDDERFIVNTLSRPEGISGILTVKQNSKRGGTRYLLTMRVNLTPSGDLPIVQEDTGKITVTLTGEVIANTAWKDSPYGRLVELKA